MRRSQSGPPPSGDLRTCGINRGTPVRFSFDGHSVTGFPGESVAAALMAAGHRTLRDSPRTHEPRGAFCWIGVCQECTVTVDGVRRPACRLPVRDGLTVLSGTVA